MIVLSVCRSSTACAACTLGFPTRCSWCYAACCSCSCMLDTHLPTLTGTVHYNTRTTFHMLQGKAPVLMPILKGGFIFAADLIRALDPCPEGLVVEFVSARWVPTNMSCPFVYFIISIQNRSSRSSSSECVVHHASGVLWSPACCSSNVHMQDWQAPQMCSGCMCRQPDNRPGSSVGAHTCTTACAPAARELKCAVVANTMRRCSLFSAPVGGEGYGVDAMA
jgi:hypothetical protein